MKGTNRTGTTPDIATIAEQTRLAGVTGPTRIVVIGASAGGVAALQRLVSKFEPDWPLSVFITLHIGRRTSLMPDILSRVSRLHSRFAKHNMPYGRGVYLAPPDRHLIIGSTTTLLSSGPKENHSRPAIDPMFRSAARSRGPRAIGILLTGRLYDGMNGLYEIQQRGGTTIVQDPADAEVPDIPRNALARMQPDFVVPLDQIPNVIAEALKDTTRTELRSGA